MTTQIAVTGLGATTPLGGDVTTTWDGALAGRSGAAPLDPAWLERYPQLPVSFAARLAQPVSEVLTRQEIKRNDPSGQYALVAAREAWADAGAPEVEPSRLAVSMASGIGGVWTLLTAYDTLNEKGPRRILPLTVPMLMPNGPAAALGIEFGARAGVHTPVSACASGAEALAQGIDLIRRGLADVVIAGGTEAAIHPLPIAGFCAMQALSTRNDDPAGASRPYDVDRDGFVMGEGAGVLVLEDLDHAQARGATGDHDVGFSAADQANRLSHRLGAGGAGRHRGVHPGPGPELDPERRGWAVRHQHRHGQRQNPPRSLFQQRVVGGQQGPDPADPRGHRDRQPGRLHLRGTGIGPRLAGRDQGVLAAGIEALDLLPGEYLGDRLGQLTGERRRQRVPLQPGRVEGSGARAAGECPFPGRGDVTAEGCGRPQTGDCDLSDY